MNTSIRRMLILIFTMSIVGILAVAQEPTDTPLGYESLLYTEIRGISEDDIEGYRAGAGLGFALPAELNGYPGPRHILDFSDELKLNSDQLEEIQGLYDEMLPQAIDLGEQILQAEAELELAFREETITPEYLETQLDFIEGLRSGLRYVHLSTHLSTITILTTHQIQQNNVLRGYSDEDHSMDHG